MRTLVSLGLFAAVCLGGEPLSAVAEPALSVCGSAATAPRMRLRVCSELFRQLEDSAAKARVLLFRGSAQLDLGDLPAALGDFDAAIALNAGDAVAFNARGVARFRIGRFRDAIDDYDAALQRDIAYAAAFHNRANARLALGDLKQAERDFAAVIELRPDVVGGFVGRGQVRYVREQYWAAYRDLLRALNIDGADGYSLLWLQLARLRLQDRDGHRRAVPDAGPADAEWPALLLSLLLDKTEPATALRAARVSEIPLQQDRECQVHFFAGQRAELSGDLAVAAEHYRQALEIGSTVRIERIAAAMALRRLEAVLETRSVQ